MTPRVAAHANGRRGGMVAVAVLLRACAKGGSSAGGAVNSDVDT